MRRAAILTAALLAAGGATAAERLVAQTPDLVAVTESRAPCGQPQAVTLRARNAAFFMDQAAVQRAADGVRAILSFECARTAEIRLTGQTQAGGPAVWTAAMGDRTGWLVEADAAPQDQAPALTVAGLDLGITPAQAETALAAEFGGQPRFDSALSRIAASEGPEGAIDEPVPPIGARRLEAVFTGDQAPRLRAITLRQSVDGDQRDDIVAALIDRYGQPDNRGDGPGAVSLGWGETLAGAPGRRALEATVETHDGLTVLTLVRQDPADTGAPRLRARF
ncbi:MAG: hypothetical protein ACK4WC_03785 [Rubrimonas sp.]